MVLIAAQFVETEFNYQGAADQNQMAALNLGILMS